MYIALAVLPGLLLLALIYAYDKLHPEPKREVAKLFVLGALVVLPAGVIERTLLDHASAQPTTWRGLLATAFFVAGMVEEFLKAAVFERTVLDRGRIHAPVDAIVYACAIGLGFATVENVLYVTTSGFWTAVVRALTAVPAHFMFAIVMGYQFARARFLGTSERGGTSPPPSRTASTTHLRWPDRSSQTSSSRVCSSHFASTACRSFGAPGNRGAFDGRELSKVVALRAEGARAAGDPAKHQQPGALGAVNAHLGALVQHEQLEQVHVGLAIRTHVLILQAKAEDAMPIPLA